MRKREGSGQREPLAGSVERVTFHNPDTGFAVLRVRVRGHRELVTVVGFSPAVSPGEYVQASGEWENTVEHGRQFRASLLEVTAPESLEGIERYLGSGLIRGVGPELARRLVSAFGDRVFEVVDEHPERLKTVEGIGPVRLRRILEGFEEQRAIRGIMVFLQSHGVGTARAVRIYRTYGADAVPAISDDPYRLAREIRGIGFRTADRIAERLGIPRTAPIRAQAGLGFVLGEAVARGHCALPREELLASARELLGIPGPILTEALEAEVKAERFVLDEVDGEELVFLTPLWRAERLIGRRLSSLASGQPPWPAIDTTAALQWAQRRLAVELAESQRRAVAQALTSPALVITGGPGVGKTTLMRAVLAILAAKGVRLALCAPTGRAAKRLAESAGMEAKTIHRLLEIDPRGGGFRRHRNRPLECDLLVVDEASMVDVRLMAALLEALPETKALLLVGDVDQLPSVGPGQVLRDVIDSQVVPVARLTEIFRQAAQSRIVTSAHGVNQGRLPELLPPPESQDASDFYFVDIRDREDALGKVVHIVCERIPRRFGFDPVAQIQVLSPMNRGSLGARALNLELQSRLNPPRPEAPQVERFGWTFRLGDKVMQTENDYDKDVFNGDLGRIAAVDSDSQELEIEFDRRRVPYRFGELDQLSLAYATTIHKAQGSEYPAVVLVLTMQHYVMLRRNLVYTGMTRGRDLVVLVCEKRALAAAVRGGAEGRRHSKLLAWITRPQ